MRQLEYFVLRTMTWLAIYTPVLFHIGHGHTGILGI